jgi:hypothetical protein
VIAIEKTTDEQFIKSVFLNPEIYAGMKDDRCPDEPVFLSSVDMKALPGFFLRATVDGVVAGCYWLMWKGRDLEAHTALLPHCRGGVALAVTREALRFVFANTECGRVISYAWSDCPAVKWFCRKVGMTELLTCSYPNTRKGQMVDVTYYSISREAFV